MIYKGKGDAEIKSRYLHLKVEESQPNLTFPERTEAHSKGSSSEAVRAQPCSVYVNPEMLRLLAGHLAAATTLTNSHIQLLKPPAQIANRFSLLKVYSGLLSHTFVSEYVLFWCTISLQQAPEMMAKGSVLKSCVNINKN